MGSQSPMATLRGFVEAVWTNDPRLRQRGRRESWSKHDAVSGNYELRRIATGRDEDGVSTDFYEFYWAHLIEGVRIGNVLWWLWRLLGRSRARVPDAVRPLWFAGRVALGVLALSMLVWGWVILSLVHSLHESVGKAIGWAVVGAVMVAVWIFLSKNVLVNVVGDATSYLTSAPENINARSRIRTLGVNILTELHDPSHDYERIVIVGHSLGSVIGYDLLGFFWGKVHEGIARPRANLFAPVQDAGEALRSAQGDAAAPAFAAFRQAQRDLARQPEVSRIWRITDFVTLGSPLTHAHFLLVNDRNDPLRSEEDLIGGRKARSDPDDRNWLVRWHERHAGITGTIARLFTVRAIQREFAICPPLPESGRSFTFWRRDEAQAAGSGNPPPLRVAHHAAQFAVTRWTNIYAPRSRVLWGDPIGGAVGPIFGPGVRDVALAGAAGKRFVAHTLYWDAGRYRTRAGTPDREHLEALRAAINLLDQPDEKAFERHREALAEISREPATAPPPP